jgi:hypothetical protein
MRLGLPDHQERFGATGSWSIGLRLRRGFAVSHCAAIAPGANESLVLGGG